MENQYFTRRSAASFLGVSEATMHNWKKSGRLVPTINVAGRTLFYSKDQLDNAKKDLYEIKRGPGRPPRGF